MSHAHIPPPKSPAAEYAALLRRAERGELTPDGFKRAEQLLPHAGQLATMPSRRGQ